MRPSKIAWGICIIGLALLPVMWLFQISRPVSVNNETVAGVSLGGEFTLTDHTGKTVTDRSWPDQFLLIYFGFTHCPDVCPLGLSIMTEAMRALPESEQSKIQPLLITVDPERDTAKALANYVTLFHPRLVGLTGTSQQIDAVKQAYRVYAEKQGDGKDYMVNHSSFTYLMRPNGQLAHVFPHNTPPEEMTKQLAKTLAD